MTTLSLNPPVDKKVTAGVRVGVVVVDVPLMYAELEGRPDISVEDCPLLGVSLSSAVEVVSDILVLPPGVTRAAVTTASGVVMFKVDSAVDCLIVSSVDSVVRCVTYGVVWCKPCVVSTAPVVISFLSFDVSIVVLAC